MNTDYKNRRNLVFFDLETQKSADEVGGWSNIAKLGLSLAVTHSEKDGYKTFLEHQVDTLVDYLKSADAIVGFNHVEFDYEVLTAYTNENLRALENIDMFLDLYGKTGIRISLDHLAKVSLGRKKSADGLMAIQWYKEGRLDLIEDYCRQDVALTRALYYRGCDKGCVVFMNRGQRVNVEVNW
ncbi:MAG: ribonuclease H-like domain-containing protein [Desulfomonilaceae bacterium]